MLGFIAERMGLDASGPIAITKIRDAMAQRTGESGSSNEDKKKEGDSKSEEPPLVPGFGVQSEVPRVASFGERVGVQRAGVASPSPSSSGRSRRGGPSGDQSPTSAQGQAEALDRYKGFADGIIKRYDRNGNGKLEKDEWGEMRGDPKASDGNGDGVITKDELAAGLAKRFSGGGDGKSESSDSEEPKSYRFLTALERLPDKLPGWFSASDKNADGQVAMAEYSDFYDDRKAQEFEDFDLNNDGVITPNECLEVEGPKDEGRGGGPMGGFGGGMPGGFGGMAGGFGGMPGGFGGGGMPGGVSGGGMPGGRSRGGDGGGPGGSRRGGRR